MGLDQFKEFKLHVTALEACNLIWINISSENKNLNSTNETVQVQQKFAANQINFKTENKTLQ